MNACSVQMFSLQLFLYIEIDEEFNWSCVSERGKEDNLSS